MNDENLSLNENQSGDSSTQGENEPQTSGTESENQETEQGIENQEPSNSEDNPPNENQEPSEDTQEPSNQNRISEQIATLKKALEHLREQNEQGFNQELEIAKLQEILQEIEQLRREIFIKQEERLEESETYFALVGVKVALLEKLKARNEC